MPETKHQSDAEYLNHLADNVARFDSVVFDDGDAARLRSIAAKLAQPPAQPTPPADRGEKPLWVEGQRFRLAGLKSYEHRMDYWVKGNEVWTFCRECDRGENIADAYTPSSFGEAIRAGKFVPVEQPAADAPTPSPAPVEAADFEPLTVQILDAVVPSVNAEDLATFDESTFDTPSPAPVEPFTLASLSAEIFSSIEAADKGQRYTISRSGHTVLVEDQQGEQDWTITIEPTPAPSPAEPVVTPAPSAQEERVAESLLTFAKFREANAKRCEEVFHPVNDWSPSDWANALAGEVGEACNFVKKLRRLGETPETIPDIDTPSGRYVLLQAQADIGKELADVVAYADLLAARLGIDLGQAVAEKFNEVSERVGSSVFLPGTRPAPANPK